MKNLGEKLMENHVLRTFTIMDYIAPVIVAFIFIAIVSLIKEPNKQKFNAVFMGGAGAAYLSGGLGLLEFVFCSVITWLAFKGLDNYKYIGIAWLLHTCWDIIHHFYGNPIVTFAVNSSGQCAICDVIIAIWFFFNAPSIYEFKSKNNYKYN